VVVSLGLVLSGTEQAVVALWPGVLVTGAGWQLVELWTVAIFWEVVVL
jgi:hypothetical protein